MKRIGNAVTHDEHCRFWRSGDCDCAFPGIHICPNCREDFVEAGRIVCIACMAKWLALKPGYSFTPPPPPENEPWTNWDLFVTGCGFLFVAGMAALAWRLA